MYRDARPSIVARIRALKQELNVAEQDLASVQAKRKHLSLLVFPLFEDFWANVRSLRQPKEPAALYTFFTFPMHCAGLLGLLISGAGTR